MKKHSRLLLTLILSFLCVGLVFGQGKLYEGPNDPAGDISSERSGYMNGNRVMLYYENNTQLADYPRINTSKWPNDYTGSRMLDVVSVLIGGEVYLKNDSIPITDLDEAGQLAAAGELDTLFYIQSTGFAPSNMDDNYDGTVEWGFYPVPGYMNETQDYPAMSNKPNSWPLAGWPSSGLDKKWLGEWNGRFGRGVTYADLESYFVANDAQDMEYIIQRNDPEEKLIEEGLRYWPRPDMNVGDINPDVTIQRGLPWGGLGLRVAVRGFQWNNPEARDMIFWEYNISNISDYDLPMCGFGYFIDNSIGGDTGNDNEEGFFDKILDLSYVWEGSNIGQGGLIPGIIGIAYLESPGRPYDLLDNDDDGLNDEKRDNLAGTLIGATDGIEDMDKFLSFYKYQIEDLHEHYEGDEDQDWQNGYDANGNGTYSFQGEDGLWYVESGEWAGDDVGLDGVGPADLNYFGPDVGECNHQPDFEEGVGCEPNFAATDVSEADMVGLTSFKMFDWPQWQDLNIMLGQDKVMWLLMDSHNLDEGVFKSGGPGSVYEVFGSTPFPFFAGRTERISMGMLFAFESIASLRSDDHYAPRMFRLKETAQVIYERDYRFAQPPLMPTLKATAGDGNVVLTWDDLSDKRTREPFLDNVNDFEGYKVYRATDKLFSDAEVITDGQGNKMSKKALFQCDVINHKTGYADYGLVEGSAFYLGDDTGVKHYYIDEDVHNGITYYYAVVAYDYGVPDLDVSPTENNIVIELDESESIVRIGQNVQVVVPKPRAAGYMPAAIAVDEERTSPRFAEGILIPGLVDYGSVKAGHTYEATFTIDTTGHFRTKSYLHPMDFSYATSGLAVYDITDGGRSKVYAENAEDGFPSANLEYDEDDEFWSYKTDSELTTEIFDGIQVTMTIPADTVLPDYVNSGWVTGEAPINIQYGEAINYFPWEYEIVFTDSDTAYRSIVSRNTGVNTADGRRIDRDSLITELDYSFYAINKAHLDSTGEYEKLDLMLFDQNGNGTYEPLEDIILVGHAVERRGIYYLSATIFSIDFRWATDESQLPEPFDVYRITFHRPLSGVDSFVFTVNPGDELDKDNLKTVMDSIKVVPNPYIATDAMEPAVGNKFLNQRRQILFTHIPADCEIRIFTSSGILVDRIDVSNEPDNGAVHWDVLSREGLEVAAGMYVYHVKSNKTGDEKVGKFAVIK